MTIKDRIKKVAVIGSGVMGGAIAAHVANSGTPVVLLDIVPKNARDRNQLAKASIERMLKADPAPFTHKRNASRIVPGNMEDDIRQLESADWIIEVVIEDIAIKQELYKKIDKVRKKDAIVSSNTSTIPLKELVKGMPDAFAQYFLITHFFNPPRYMHLLELVQGEKTSGKVVEAIREFADITLGKGIVACKDTPGFIANRIGCFWLTAGVNAAFRLGVSVEEADAVMGRPAGIPKTGVFGLLDLIGIDLMPLIAKEMQHFLPASDPFCQQYHEAGLIKKMIEDGYTGRKGKGGFYRLNTENGGKVKEAINLTTGHYAKAEKPVLESVDAAKQGLRALVTHKDKGGSYAWAVLSETLAYAASLVPEIAEDIVAVDQAMKWGYNWKYGPFELIDRLGDTNQAGPTWLAGALAKEGKKVPSLLTKAGKQPFYNEEGGKRFYLTGAGKYNEIIPPINAWVLMDKTRAKTPVLKNPSAKLWDIGDGIACLQYTSKMNSVDPFTLEMIVKSIEKVKTSFKGLVIANDADNFCVGANLGFLLFAANIAAWKTIEDTIKQGQDAYMGLKYAPFPVVVASTGMALGGGCEILMHCDAVQAHSETYTGLVEVGVGVIPGWGGCKEMLLRNMARRNEDASVPATLGRMFSKLSLVKALNVMPVITRSFETIAMAKVSKSAEEAKDIGILSPKVPITMNRSRLLADAKATCLAMAKNYIPPERNVTIRLPGRTARAALYMGIKSFVKSGKATPHDETVCRMLAEVLSGGNTDITRELTEQDLLDLEREAFMELVKTRPTLDRIEHMLETGKPLRN